jgi:hypothetical protein
VIRQYNCENNKLISLKGLSDPKKILKLCVRNNPIWVIFKLFKTYDRYQTSIEDYNYLRGTNIVRRRFELACIDAEIEMPDSIPGYKYIDL